MTSGCPDERKNQGLKLYGYGISGQGFYSLQVLGLKLAEQQAVSGVISISEGVATVQKVEAELKHLIQANWDWNVRKISEMEYVVVFPSKDSLETWSKTRGVEFALHSIKAKVDKSTLNPNASSVLLPVWVRISGIPLYAKTTEIVKEIASTVGEPAEADEISLIRVDPIRVKVFYRDPSTINCYVEIFLNSMGV